MGIREEAVARGQRREDGHGGRLGAASSGSGSQPGARWHLDKAAVEGSEFQGPLPVSRLAYLGGGALSTEAGQRKGTDDFFLVGGIRYFRFEFEIPLSRAGPTPALCSPVTILKPLMHF